MNQKLKSFLLDDALFYSLLILFVALIAFNLGQRSQMKQNNTFSAPAVVVHEVEEVEAQSGGVAVVGSRAGTKYHLLDCPGAKQMKETNKIYFDSIELARAAGYEPAGNCSGLE